MTPFDVGVVMMHAALQMRAVSEWMAVNHEKTSPDVMLFLGCFLGAVNRHAVIVMRILDDPQTQVIAGRRCIFY